MEYRLKAVTCVEELETPFLALDLEKFSANIERLQNRLDNFHVQLRPHLKTVKSVEAAGHLLKERHLPATVSTLKEAEVFFRAGYSNLLYAVGISPQKLDRIVALRKQGADISVLLDSIQQAEYVVRACITSDEQIPVFIEIDCDGHRGGLKSDDPTIVMIAKILTKGGAELRGVLTHAGESYSCISQQALIDAAENERLAAVKAADSLRKASLPCPIVSIGSTPTAHFGINYDGVTEVRAGVYAFFDLVMVGAGVCRVEDIALSVVATVIGHNKDRGWVFIDAGWMALSSDHGTGDQADDQGYGLVCDMAGRVIDGLFVKTVNQEHGILALKHSCKGDLPDFSVGTRLRILPNHACATAAQHDCYNLLSSSGTEFLGRWQRIQGW